MSIPKDDHTEICKFFPRKTLPACLFNRSGSMSVRVAQALRHRQNKYMGKEIKAFFELGWGRLLVWYMCTFARTQ